MYNSGNCTLRLYVKVAIFNSSTDVINKLSLKGDLDEIKVDGKLNPGDSTEYSGRYKTGDYDMLITFTTLDTNLDKITLEGTIKDAVTLHRGRNEVYISDGNTMALYYNYAGIKFSSSAQPIIPQQKPVTIQSVDAF